MVSKVWKGIQGDLIAQAKNNPELDNLGFLFGQQ